MKILLTNAMADELLYNEYEIKNQLGAYRPHYDPFTMSYMPVIKCWPLKDFKGDFNQEREVIPGMENEVADIAFATIQDDVIEYKETPVIWKKGTLDNYNILIYTPKFDNKTILITAMNQRELFDKLKEYQIVSDTDLEERNRQRMAWDPFIISNIDKWFSKYQGICTYIYLVGDGVAAAGKWDNKKEW